MMRRVVQASVRRSRAVQARFDGASGNSQIGVSEGDRRKDGGSSGGKSDEGTWYSGWTWKDVVKVGLAYCIPTGLAGIAWQKYVERRNRIECLDEFMFCLPKEPSFTPRPCVVAAANEMEDSVKNFKIGEDQVNPFIMLSGPKGAGKSTAVKYGFAKKKGVIFLETDLDAGDNGRKAFHEAMEEKYNEVAGGRAAPAAKRLLKEARLKCEAEYKKPLVVYWKLGLKSKKDVESLNRVAQNVAGVARSLTYDNAGCVALIIETSNPVLASLIPKMQSGCCKVIHIDTMNFDELVEAAEMDSMVGRHIEKRAKNGEVMQQGLQTDDLKYYYSCFGGNLREMGRQMVEPLLEEYKKTKDVEEFRKAFRERTADAYEKLADTYLEAESSFSDDEKKLCELIARQGPGGLRTTLEQKRHVRKIRERNASMDILREQDLTTRLHKMAHARCILAKDEENTVSPKAMEEYGWLPKTDKAGSA